MNAGCLAEFLVLKEKSVMAKIADNVSYIDSAPIAFGAMSAYHFINEDTVKKGYKVYGAVRRTSSINTARLSYMDVLDNIELVSMDLGEITNIQRTIEKIEPDEIYNLAAQSHVAVSFDTSEYTSQVNALGPLRVLQAIVANGLSETCRFYQASTSEMFGKVMEIPQTEKTPFYPRSPYGVAKLSALLLSKIFTIKTAKENIFQHSSYYYQSTVEFDAPWTLDI